MLRLARLFNFQTHQRSLKVIDAHYNLGNDLFEAMLGPSMAYSCGYWDNAETLDQAQLRKYDLICKKLQLQPGDRVLDMGYGWGGLSRYMAENYECHVVGISLSTEQSDWAKEYCKGLSVEFYLCDYRDDKIWNAEKQPFDKVVSVEFCEHVGYKNYQALMDVVSANLKDHGLFLIQVLGNQKKYINDPWFNKYIFPMV